MTTASVSFILLDTACSPSPLASPLIRVDKHVFSQYCPDELGVVKKDLDTGVVSISSYHVDGQYCAVEQTFHGERQTLHSFLGLIPSMTYSNFNAINSIFVSIVTEDTVREADFEEYSSRWGAPAVSHVHMEKISSNPMTLGNDTYPSVQLEQTGTGPRGQIAKTYLTFSMTHDGKFFASEAISASPDHTRENFRATDVFHVAR